MRDIETEKEGGKTELRRSSPMQTRTKVGKQCSSSLSVRLATNTLKSDEVKRGFRGTRQFFLFLSYMLRVGFYPLKWGGGQAPRVSWNAFSKEWWNRGRFCPSLFSSLLVSNRNEVHLGDDLNLLPIEKCIFPFETFPHCPSPSLPGATPSNMLTFPPPILVPSFPPRFILRRLDRACISFRFSS